MSCLSVVKNAPEMKMFKKVLKYLLEKKYKTDNMELVRMVSESINL